MFSAVRGAQTGGTGFFPALRCILSLVLLLAAGRPATAEELTAERLFDPGRLCDIQIVIPEADWQALRLQSRDIRSAFTEPMDKPFKYFKADLSIDNVKLGSVGLRKKGFLGSLDDTFPSLKIDFDRFDSQTPIKGLETLTLNNNKQDPSLLSQFLAYRLFNAAGVHAPRVGFARVTVNGEYLGVYTNIESIGKPFLDRRFGESSGKLYEGTLADFYPSALSNLEIKINRKSPDSGTTLRLANLLTSKEPLVLEEVGKLVDLDAFLRYWAIESLLVFWDGYCNNQNNFWVYEQQNGKLFFMPWGADMAFTGGTGFFGIGGVAVFSESMLANRLYRTEGVPERYRQTMVELLETVWKEPELLAAIDSIEALVDDELHNRQANARREMKAVRKFIATRRDSMTKQLRKWPVKVSDEPRKPVYTVPIGAVNGTFATQWTDQPPERPFESGSAELKIVYNGEEVVFQKLGVSAQPAPRSPFDGPAKPAQEQPQAAAPTKVPEVAPAPASNPVEPVLPPASIVFTGVRASDSKKVTLTLTVDRGTFAASAGKSVPVRGTFLIGDERFSIFNPFPGRAAAGHVQFAEAGVAPGDRVVGKLEIVVSDTRGGMMGRRGPRDATNAPRPELAPDSP